jgi:hypothetical protein
MVDGGWWMVDGERLSRYAQPSEVERSDALSLSKCRNRSLEVIGTLFLNESLSRLSDNFEVVIYKYSKFVDRYY